MSVLEGRPPAFWRDPSAANRLLPHPDPVVWQPRGQQGQLVRFKSRSNAEVSLLPFASSGTVVNNSFEAGKKEKKKPV